MDPVPSAAEPSPAPNGTPRVARPWDAECYEELRRLAGTLLSEERLDHTLEPAALVHETWLRLLRSRNADRLPREAFLGLAAQSMRRILTEHARRRAAGKRGGHARRTTLAGKHPVGEPEDFVLDLDDALAALGALDPGLVRLAELRFYGECSLEEIAATLGVSVRTVKRRWRFTRAWLQRHIEERDA